MWTTAAVICEYLAGGTLMVGRVEWSEINAQAPVYGYVAPYSVFRQLVLSIRPYAEHSSAPSHLLDTLLWLVSPSGHPASVRVLPNSCVPRSEIPLLMCVDVGMDCSRQVPW